MATLDELKKVLAEFPEKAEDRERLKGLRDFLAEMKKAGIAKTREYDLPRPDTIGRASSGLNPRSEVLPKPERQIDAKDSMQSEILGSNSVPNLSTDRT